MQQTCRKKSKLFWPKSSTYGLLYAKVDDMSCAVTNLMSLPCLLNFTTSLRDDGQRPKLSSRLFFKHALPSFLTFTENRFVKMKPGMELRYCTLPSCLRSQGRGGGLQQGGRDAVCLYKLKEVTVKHGTCQVTGNSFET